MNYSNFILVFFGLSTSFIYQNVQARLDTEYITDGIDVIEDQFKFQVSIQVNNKHICGGGIIADKFILTAAHCLINDDEGRFEQDQMIVVAGALALNTTDTSLVRVEVEKAYVPREYDPIRPNPDLPYREIGDIAVLKLKNGLGLHDNAKLRKLKLPVKTGGNYPNYENEKATVAGYGYTDSRDPDSDESDEADDGSNNILKFAETTVKPKETCSKLFFDPMYGSHICAGVTQQDFQNYEGICSGDSGGPLVHNGNTVIGVMSDSPLGCTKEKYPAAYTRVSAYVPFIKNAMDDQKSNNIRVATWTV